MASYPFLYVCFFLLSLTARSSSTTNTSTITISISQSSKTTSSDPWKRKNHLASSSLARARHFKNPNNSSFTQFFLFYDSYGGYFIFLSYGGPPLLEIWDVKSPNAGGSFLNLDARIRPDGSENCNYAYYYAPGATTIGFLISWNLSFARKRVSGFVVGCSTFSTQLPFGIAGFGHRKLSVPSQRGEVR